ncbi:MAG: hypothetical protein ACRDK9_00925 [Solirubrobacterales bacterium]
MGILDDAIRQHLELKRRQGADANELERLESEAFGPPARPGEPDFPDREEAGGVAEAAVAEPPEPGAEVEAEAPAAAADESSGLFDVEIEEPRAEVAEEPRAGVSEEPLGEVTEEPPPEGVEAPPPEPAAESQAEVSDVGELDFDELDLELDEGLEEAPAGGAEALGEREAVPDPEAPPIESLDTVEHPIEEAEAPPMEEPPPVEEPEPPPVEEPAPADEPEPPAEDDEPPAAGEGDGDDVLEETPEFLRDQPEDDELWFEQGKPKDFDF